MGEYQAGRRGLVTVEEGGLGVVATDEDGVNVVVIGC